PCPFPLSRRVTIAFLTAAQGLLLVFEPTGIRQYARFGNQRNRRLFTFPARIDSKACRHRVHSKANIKLSSFPFSWRGNGKLQVHMILVKRLVLRETNIPVDPRKIRTGSAARI